jgi:hypothetical protein
MGEALDEANRKAVVRSSEIMRKHAPDLALVADQERKANDIGFVLTKRKDVSRVPFVQTLTDNVKYLVSQKFLTPAELSLMFRLSTLVAPQSNEIIVDIHHRHTPANEEIAEAIGYKERQYCTLIQSLIKKGIVYEIVDAEEIRQHGHAVRERMLLMNPELFIACNKNHIEVTLCGQHIMCDKLEKYQILLPWKLWYAPSLKFGRMYKRETYLRKMKENNKKPA